ncbi:translation initiation factor eIF4e [Clavulina sp. PMI_390]|nr:translation initiation factor eIF4e [Clavulina sp. PMI_390]
MATTNSSSDPTKRKGSRLPTLEALARRINPTAASASTDSISSNVSEAGSASSASTAPTITTTLSDASRRPRLEKGVLRNRSISSTVVEPPTSEGVTPAAETVPPPAVVAVEPEEEPAPKEKEKFYKGYKNVPSLDAITERLRARTNSHSLAAAGATLASSDPVVPVEAVEQLSLKEAEPVAPPVRKAKPVLSGLGAVAAMRAPGIDFPAPPLSPAVEKGLAAIEADPEPSTKSPSDLHPLQYTWTLFHDSKRPLPASLASPSPSALASVMSPTDQGHYAANLTAIGDFETVEGFCRYFNWLKPPSQLEVGSNYHLFKSGIRPVWEDEANAEGGKWVITMRSNPALLDRSWSWLAMALVGEQIDERDEICGAVVSVRNKIDRIQVWTRTKTVEDGNLEVLNAIGKKLYKLLDLANEPSIGLEFQHHSEDKPPRNKFLYISPRLGDIPGGETPGGAKSGWRGSGGGIVGGGAFGAFGTGGKR